MNTPKIGDGATISYWTDRRPATVIDVSQSGKTAKIQLDKATQVKIQGERQTYTYEADPAGPIYSIYLSKSGSWKVRGGGNYIEIGKRRYYEDPCF